MDPKPAILVIEDEEGARRAVEMILARKGFEVETADRVETGLEKARQGRHDLALVDIKLPDGEGVDLVKPLREINPEMQIVLMTAYASVDTAIRAVNEGAWAYATKPLNMDEVLQIIRNALEHQALRRQNRKYLEDLQAELAERRAVEAELAETNALLERLFDTTHTLFAFVDTNLVCVRVNRAYTQAAGKPAQAFAGGPLFDPSTCPETVRLIEESLRSGRPRRNLKTAESLFGPDDKRVWDWSVYPVRGPGGEVEGVLVNLHDVTERERARERIERYQRLLQTLSSRMSLIEERERRRLAEVLHEQIGQMLALAKIRLLAMVEGANANGTKEEPTRIAEIIGDAICRTRSLTTELSPPLLFELGLEAALKKLAEEFSASERPKVHFQAEGTERALSEDVAIVVYRAVRELLTNAAKHSGASEAQVLLERLGGALRVTVTDNGSGFDARQFLERGNTEGGFGLLSIRERFGHLGGEFQIVSQPGEGVKAVMTVGAEPRDETA